MNRVRCLVVFAYAWSGLALADTAEKWLARINNATANLSYQGVFVYGYESSLESMRVARRVDAGSVKERIYSLNGAPREIIRDDSEVWCYAPEQNIGVHEYREASKQSFPDILPRRFDRLSDNYELNLGRVDRIADRMAQEVLIEPLDEFRYGYVLWADRETGLLLKATLVDRNKNPIERYMFTQVEIGVSIPEAALLPLTAKDKLQWFGVDSKTAAPGYSNVTNPGWTVTGLPDGFSVARQIRRMSPIHNRIMEQYVYSDGLAAVSVFIELVGDKTLPRIEGVSRIGAVHAFGHTQDGYHITAVGEVPSATVDKMGMSVSRIEQ